MRLLRANGLLFIATTLAVIAMLVLGLGIASWHSASRAIPYEDGRGILRIATSDIDFRLTAIELCELDDCRSTPTWDHEVTFGRLAIPLLVVGIAFGLLVLRIAERRIAGAVVRSRERGAAYGLAIALAGLAIACMAASPDVAAAGLGDHRVFDILLGLRPTLDLALGGVFTLAGTALGVLVAIGSTPEPQPVALGGMIVAVRAPRRRHEPTGPQRGPETDPFRAPPAPTFAVVHHARPAPTPVAADPTKSGRQPRLLR